MQKLATPLRIHGLRLADFGAVYHVSFSLLHKTKFLCFWRLVFFEDER